MANNGSQGAKAAMTQMGELEKMVSESPKSDAVCLKLARILSVHRSEIALLRLERGSLRFIFPVELRSAGVLPLTGSAVAARTAATRTPLLSNTFMRVRHASLFEAVRLSKGEDDQAMDQMPIQKIMSVPVVKEGSGVLGVVQVSRKGKTLAEAGPDFTHPQLRELRTISEALAPCILLCNKA